MIWILGLIIVLTYLIYVKTNHTEKLGRMLPGDLILPLIGNVYRAGLNKTGALKHFEGLFKKFNHDIFRLFFGPYLLVFLTQPDDVKAVLLDENITDKLREYDYLKPFLGNGLLTSTGERSINRRKLLMPTFHYQILHQFTEVFDRQSDKMIQKLRQVANGQITDIQMFSKMCTLDIILETAMGISINAQDHPETDVVKAICMAPGLFTERAFGTWERFDIFYRFSSSYNRQQQAVETIHKFCHDLIMKRRPFTKESIEKLQRNSEEKGYRKNAKNSVGEKQKMAFLDILLTAEDPLTDVEIIDEVCNFIFAGHETTATAISFGMYELANNPEIQEKVHQEQINVMGNHKTHPCGFGDLQDMLYLDLFVKELLRLHPPVPIIGRLNKEDININGRKIPAGTGIIPFIYAMNRNPKVFNDPEKFDPDRFLPENRVNSHPYDHVPFSAGARNCLGQKQAVLEIKSILSKIVRNFKLSSAGPEYALQECVLFTLKSLSGINVRLELRS